VLTLRSRADCRCCRPSLKFYKHVYDARQDRRDLEFAGHASARYAVAGAVARRCGQKADRRGVRPRVSESACSSVAPVR